MINRTIAIDPIFNQLSIEAQWLYMRMLPFMDDYGKMTGDCFEIKYLCIPSSNRPPRWIKEQLDDMARLNLVAFEQGVCVQFLGFEKNQKIGHRRATSQYPTLIDEERSEKVDKGRNNIIEENIKEPNLKKDTYSKPTLKDVEDYFLEKKIPSYKENALKFWSHYESVNWFRGKTKIKKWKMCVKNWDFGSDDDVQKSGIDFSQFEKNDINGEMKAYCTKCEKEYIHRFPFEIARGSRCCNKPYKPNRSTK